MRAFGTTELVVSEFGLGCARIGGIFQQDGAGFHELLRGALDLGINFYDTSDLYSQGESETLIGKAFRHDRSRVVIATKAGYKLPTQRKLVSRVKPLVRPLIRALGLRRDRLPAAVRGSLEQDFSPESLRKALEGSLKRLRTDYVDLFQLHSPPAEAIARGEWLGALEELKRAGKIRYYGISCDTLEACSAALGFSSISSLQFTLSLLEQRAVDGILPETRLRNLAVIARECLANGLLVKDRGELDLEKYVSSPEEKRLREEQLGQYGELAKRRDTSLLALALDFVRNTEGVSVALLGARNLGQLQDLLARLSPKPAARSVEGLA